ncbi:MAG: hypothetical protein COC15_01465 [Legionellales bacterium]|nr:MAG: hypothetical protein COC15_01465 [Legionellales bacterium]
MAKLATYKRTRARGCVLIIVLLMTSMIGTFVAQMFADLMLQQQIVTNLTLSRSLEKVGTGGI